MAETIDWTPDHGQTLNQHRAIEVVAPPDPREHTRKQKADSLVIARAALRDVVIDENWADYVLCANIPTNVFFPSTGAGVEEARKICAECPVKEPCLEFALTKRIDHGVWGGVSERGRRRLLKQRRAARTN